jgi:hypothetical protein
MNSQWEPYQLTFTVQRYTATDDAVSENRIEDVTDQPEPQSQTPPRQNNQATQTIGNNRITRFQTQSAPANSAVRRNVPPDRRPRLSPREIIKLQSMRSHNKSFHEISDEMGYSVDDLRTIWQQMQPPLPPGAADNNHPLTPREVLTLQRLVNEGHDWWTISDEMNHPVEGLRSVWKAMKDVATKPTAISSSQKKDGGQKDSGKKENAPPTPSNGEKSGSSVEFPATATLILHQMKQQKASWKDIAEATGQSQDSLKRVWNEIEPTSKELADKAKNETKKGSSSNDGKKPADEGKLVVEGEIPVEKKPEPKGGHENSGKKVIHSPISFVNSIV